jgi:hypothetical protein
MFVEVVVWIPGWVAPALSLDVAEHQRGARAENIACTEEHAPVVLRRAVWVHSAPVLRLEM